MTDLRKLLIEARTYHKHQSYCDQIPNGINGDCPCGLILHRARIDAALSEKVEPYGYVYVTNNTWTHFTTVKPPDDAYDEGSLVPVYAAPADQWRRVEDGLPHTDHPMRHYDRTCPACNTALPEADK